MNYLEVTRTYYANWLGIAPADFARFEIHLARSSERDKTQLGYGEPFDLYIWVAQGQVLVSYGGKAEAKLPAFAAALHGGMSAREVADLAGKTWGVTPKRNSKFVLGTLPPLTDPSHLMQGNEYEIYQEFFLACHPGCRATG